MATKTISIAIEAYRRLKDAKAPTESFSEAIKRIVKPPFEMKAWVRRVRANPLSKKAADAVEAQIARRRSSSTRER